MSLSGDVQPWPHGTCEHGILTGGAYCDKRGRWLVGGVVMCGEHKKKVLARRAGAATHEDK